MLMEIISVRRVYLRLMLFLSTPMYLAVPSHHLHAMISADRLIRYSSDIVPFFLEVDVRYFHIEKPCENFHMLYVAVPDAIMNLPM